MRPVQTVAGLILSPWLAGLDRGAGPSRDDWDLLDLAGGALSLASDRGWLALELALAGNPIWDRLAVVLRDDQALVKSARSACETLPPELMPRFGEAIRRLCLRDLWRARRLGLLGPGLPVLQTWADDLTRLADPAHRSHAERHALTGMAGELVHGGCPYLTELLTASDSVPLPVAAGRWFLHRDAVEDVTLASSLGQPISAAPRDWPEAALLWPLFARHGSTVVALLENVRAVAEGDHAPALDLFEEWRDRGGDHRTAYESIWDVQRQLNLLRTRLRPADVVVVRDGAARQAVKQAVAAYHGLPDDRRLGRPALLNAVAKLHLAAGDFRAAARDFSAAAHLTTHAPVQAEVHANASRACLEAHDSPSAMQMLLTAARLDPLRHAPFPLDRFAPVTIQSVDARGITFLCRRQPEGDTVVVRTLAAEALDGEAEANIAHAGVVRSLNHSALLQVHECGFADPVARSRPYLVLEHFEGVPLQQHVEKNGVLKPEELLSVACQMAEALRGLHCQSLIHGDLKPSSVFLRRETNPKPTLQVKLAGLGTKPSQDVSADVVGFGQACCFALFKTAEPTPAQWARVPDSLAALLQSCASADPAKRPADFNVLLTSLRQVNTRPIVTPRPAPPAPVPPPNPLAPPRTRPPRVRSQPYNPPNPVNPRRGSLAAVLFVVGMMAMCGLLRSGSSSYSPKYDPPAIQYKPYQYQPVDIPKWEPPAQQPIVPTFPPGTFGPSDFGGTDPTRPNMPYTPPYNPARPGGGFSGQYQPSQPYGPGGVPNPNGRPNTYGTNPPSPWR